jgi:hypothetical protein
MELPNPVIIGILIFLKPLIYALENYIYIMQEAKKSMSSLNLVFFLPTLQVTTCTLFYGPILYNKINTSYGADHTATDSLCIYA